MESAKIATRQRGWETCAFSCLVDFLRRRASKSPLRLLTCGNVVPRCANRWQWVLRHPRLPRFARAVAGRITGVVLLALDFVGG
jgi:hypothetical protein